ncbi:MAG: 4-(cytidine 5'-diphospho)-2-C-methyl-D-erythritol kinase, partial [Thermomicrobiales bacterium]
MSGSSSQRVDLDAPAKLNLGLEILGRRDDGFHEIATIFIAIDLFDHLTMTVDDDIRLTCDDPALNGSDNLARQALIALRTETGYGGGARLDLHKLIPVAAGLGGASSDAAAALLGARHLWS